MKENTNSVTFFFYFSQIKILIKNNFEHARACCSLLSLRRSCSKTFFQIFYIQKGIECMEPPPFQSVSTPKGEVLTQEGIKCAATCQAKFIISSRNL